MNILSIIVYFLILSYASAVDYKRQIIPDKAHLFIILLATILNGMSGLWLNLIAAAFLSIPFLIVAIKTDKLGGGDVKYIFSNGTLLGFWKGYFGNVIGLIVVILMYFMIWKKENKKERAIPMAPYLSIGYGAIVLIERLTDNLPALF